MKISIIGMGRVGSAIAFSLLHKIKIDELVLIDVVENLAKGEALDLGQAGVSLNMNCKITGSTNYSEIKESNIVIITAGKARKPGDSITREELFEFNKKIVENICEEIKKYCPDSKIIILTNPATQIGDLAKSLLKNEIEQRLKPSLSVHVSDPLTSIQHMNETMNIVVMDNQLDTSRLKYFVSKETGLPISEIKSFITGAHGEGMEINFKEKISEESKEKIKQEVLNAGRTIIELKGCTCWGIAAEVLREVQKIL